MTPWDSDKSTAQDPDNPNADEKLTADEWDNHVTEGHFPADEINFGVDGNGDPVMTDPQNSDEVIARYDRSAGEWVVSAVSADELSDGVAGSGESITRIAGDAGDVVSPVFFRVPGTFTVSSTSFSSIGANADYPVFDDSVLDIQNATARRGAVAGWVNSLSDGETLTIRVEDAPESEIELTTIGRFMGPVADISGLSTTGIKRLEAEVTGGSAELRSLCTIIAREIQ